MRAAVLLIEPLEDRIAPAGLNTLHISLDGKTATYQDTAGDTITVKTTNGAFAQNAAHTDFYFTSTTDAGQLTALDLSGQSAFNGAQITFSITPVAGGTDKVNVGYINAGTTALNGNTVAGISLSSVTVPGDLGRIDVGGGTSAVALGTLNVQTLGAMSTGTQSGLDTKFSIPPQYTFVLSNTCNIHGTIQSLNVSGNLDGFVNVQDYKSKLSTGNIGFLNVGGSLDGKLDGTGGAQQGEVMFTGTLSKGVIGGGLDGGAAASSGSIVGSYLELAKIGTITVLGSVPVQDDPNPNPLGVGTSLLGGSGQESGCISAYAIGSAKVAGDVTGESGQGSGTIQAGGTLESVIINGSLNGGNFTPGNPSQAQGSGDVFADVIESVTVGGSLHGGSGQSSGAIFATKLMMKATVMGDVQGGTGPSNCGEVGGQQVGTVVIDGSLIGGNLVTGDSNQPANFSGAVYSVTSIGSVTIGKTIAGGTGNSSGLVEAGSGAIGSVKVLGKDGNGSSIIGGTGSSSGGILTQNGAAGRIMLAGSLTGGSGSGAGVINVNGAISRVAIGGDITGGAGNSSGSLVVLGVLGSASIGGGINGGSASSGILSNSGYVQADGIGTMTVTKALVAGTATGSAALDSCGAIRSTVAIGSLTIGGLTGNPSNPAVISAEGQLNPPITATSDVAIQSVTVKGNVLYGDIVAGYNDVTSTNGDATTKGSQPLGNGVSADAQIGTVTITGNFTDSNILAGVGPSGIGTSTSGALSGAGVISLLNAVSRIARVSITGAVSADSGAYGIAAQQIVSANITGVARVLTAGPDNDTFAANNEKLISSNGAGSVYLYEV